MAYRKVPLVGGEYYHIYNRGNSKQNIFLDDEDRKRFIKLLYLCNSKKAINFRDDIIERSIDAWDFDRDEQLVSLGAWVLMPNHFHLYITSKLSPEDGPRGEGKFKSSITEYMRKLATAYSSYFNKKYSRTGSLFEGRFKSVHIESDNQAKYLFSYIHLNPIKLIEPNWKEIGVKNIPNAMEFLTEYQWSSYIDQSGTSRKENAIVNLSDFPNYFSGENVLKNDIHTWLSFSKED